MLRVCEKHAVRALPLSGLAVILGSSLTLGSGKNSRSRYVEATNIVLPLLKAFKSSKTESVVARRPRLTYISYIRRWRLAYRCMSNRSLAFILRKTYRSIRSPALLGYVKSV